MSYIRDGYVFVSSSKKMGRKGYGHIGQCVFIVGKNKNIQFKSILFPQEYWGKRIRLKVEVIKDENGMPKTEDKLFSVSDMLIIKRKAYKEAYGNGYRNGYRAGTLMGRLENEKVN